MVRRAMRNAQQTIYQLYFGAFGTQCKGTTIWFWEVGGVKFCLDRQYIFSVGSVGKFNFHVALYILPNVKKLARNSK